MKRQESSLQSEELEAEQLATTEAVQKLPLQREHLQFLPVSNDDELRGGLRDGLGGGIGDGLAGGRDGGVVGVVHEGEIMPPDNNTHSQEEVLPLVLEKLELQELPM